MKMNAQKSILVLAPVCILVLFSRQYAAYGGDFVTATNWSGSLALVLDNGVRIKAQGQRSFSDLCINLVCRDGKWDAGGVAWFDRMPALEHQVTITAAEGDPETLRLDLVVDYVSHAPVFAGGRGQYSVELKKSLGVIRGDFSGRLSPLPFDVSTNLWGIYRGYALGSSQKVDWPTCIDAGRVCSLRRTGSKVVAEIGPLPIAAPDHATVAKDEHPRLFFRRRDVEGFAGRFASGEGVAVATRLSEVLEKQRGEWMSCPGSEAAGWAVLSLVRNDGAMADKASTCARDAVAAMRANPQSMAYGRNLAGLALAYDICADRWPEDVRKTICAELSVAAVRLAGYLPQVTKSDGLLAQGQLFSGVSASHDYRLGYMRAAAGLALMAVDGDRGCGVTQERLAAADAAISGTIARLLRDGIGDHGEGTGNNGYADLIEVLLPYLQAYMSVRGVDLAAGSGVRQIGCLGVATRGVCFRRGVSYPLWAWVPFTLPFVDSESSFVRSFAEKSEYRFDDPWHGAVGAVNWSIFARAPGNASAVPAIVEDQAMGSYVLGGGKTERFLYFRGGAGPDEAAAIRGDLSLYAFGREWIASHAAARGDFSWPDAGNCNTIKLLHETKSGQKQEIVPKCAGYIDSVRFYRATALVDGSGSVCMQADAEGAPSYRARRGGSVFGFEGGGEISGSAWRTVGVDFSGTSGADVLIATVEGCLLGGVAADKYWEMDVGPVPASNVVVGSDTFLVRPAGTGASMQVVFIYPSFVYLTYVPPDGGGGGRIRALLNAKTVNKDISLDHSIKTKAFGADIDIDLGTADEVKKREENELLRRKQEASLLEILRGENYTAGNAVTRSTNTCVVVISVQKGEPPRVEPGSIRDGYLVKVGGQPVFYDDSVLVFGRMSRKTR